MYRFGAFIAAVGGALVLAASASAHAELSPAVALTKHGQLFTLAVPTEKENATTTKVELTPPDGFAIDSFVPSTGWTRNVKSTGSGEATKIQQVTWSGGQVPTEEDAVFQFLASADSSKTYSFKVRQTYSDGTVVDWSGPESSFGGASNTLAIIALIVGVLALVVALVGLFGRTGRRAVA